MLKDDSRSREEMASELSAFVGEPISMAMLNAYCSPARDKHGAPAYRFFALVALTGRWDLLDTLMQRFGVRVATQSDLKTLATGWLVEERAKYDDLIEQRLRSHVEQ